MKKRLKALIRTGQKFRSLCALALGGILMLLAACEDSQVSQQHSAPSDSLDRRPNVLLVVADDLGMLDIGAYGSEIRTPNIDRLANSGLKFTNFYTSATCSPTRAMLLTGVDSHAAGLGNMVEHMAPNQRGKQGYEGHLSDRVVTVATLLKDAGYHTYMAGKWHLGKQDAQLPYRRGFDESFVLLQGGASYFNDMMGLTSAVPDAQYRRNGETVTELPDSFYATEYYADFIIDQIERNRDSNKPFFGYLAFSAPHWPLQVKDEHLNLYQGRYDAGYDELFEERLTAAIDLELFPTGARPAMRPAHVQPWAELSDDRKKLESKTMEIYSAVVERMDYHLGRVLDYLQDRGELDNTLVVFLSDNGADGSDRSKLPGNDEWLPVAWDLSYENMGRAGSYVYPGAAWARASVGPYRMYKEFLAEGGIRAPAIISHPTVARKGTQSDTFVTVKDITPTILEYVGISHPDTSYQDREIQSLSGVSLKPFIAGKMKRPHHPETVMGWELFGQKTIRKGDWKLIWLSSKPKWLVKPPHADQWGLYNVAKDPGETKNLVTEEPEKFKEMLALWEDYARQHAVHLPVWE